MKFAGDAYTASCISSVVGVGVRLRAQGRPHRAVGTRPKRFTGSTSVHAFSVAESHRRFVPRHGWHHGAGKAEAGRSTGPAEAGHYVQIFPTRPSIYFDTLNGSLVPPTASASSPPSTGGPYALIR